MGWGVLVERRQGVEEELTGADDESEEGEGVEEVGHCGRSRLGDGRGLLVVVISRDGRIGLLD